MQNAGRYLEFDQVKTLDTEDYQDGPIHKWDLNKIEETVQNYVDEEGIHAIITFDQYGISGHPNHIACSLGVEQLAKKEKNKKLKAYKLITVGLIRKYLSIFDYLLSASDEWLYVNLKFWNNIGAMSQHWSQFVWFRWLFVGFSRYTWINTLEFIPNEYAKKEAAAQEKERVNKEEKEKKD